MSDETTAMPPAATDTDGLNELSRRGFDRALGLEYLEASCDRVRVAWQVTDGLHQPWGIVHGGVYCTVVESLASVAGQLWLTEHGEGQVVGVNNNTDFLRAVRSGRLEAAAEPVHRGRLQQLWRVTVTDADGRAVAEGRVRLQNVQAEKLGN